MAPRQQSFSEKLIISINDHLSENRSLSIEWDCQYCLKKHSGNLLKKVAAAKLAEEDKHVIKLLDPNEGKVAVINVSKNKRANIEVAKSYRESGVIYIQVTPPSEDQVISDALSRPRFVDFCINPKCKKCGNFQHEKNLVIIDSSCWKCHSPMKIAMIELHNYQPAGPDEFSEKELGLSRNKGVMIQTNFSKTVGEAYLSNTCPRCDALTGNFYLTEHLSDAHYGYLTYERIPEGYACTHCDPEN
jgi:hypothetical protein